MDEEEKELAIAGLDDDLREIISDFICAYPEISIADFILFWGSMKIATLIAEEIRKVR